MLKSSTKKQKKMVNLPVKTKNLQNGIFEFINRSKVLSEDTKRSLYEELPLLKTITEQKKYYADLLNNEEEIEKKIEKEKVTVKLPENENSEVKVISLSDEKINLETSKNETETETTTKTVIIKKKKKIKEIKKLDDNKKEVKLPEEKEEAYLLIREGKRYWCSDEFFENGNIYEDIKDEDGDSNSGKCIGKIVNKIIYEN
jgi:hypothetical protein